MIPAGSLVAAEKALAYFKSGFSCSEAVLRAFNEACSLGLPEPCCKIAAGFGAGMGGSGCVCGAVAGCVMVFGLIAGRNRADEPKGPVFPAVNELHRRFKEKYKALCCRILTRHGDPPSAKRRGLLCEQYVYEAVLISEEIIRDHLSIMSA